MALGCVPTNSAKLRSSPCAWRCSNPNTSSTAPPEHFSSQDTPGSTSVWVACAPTTR